MKTTPGKKQTIIRIRRWSLTVSGLVLLGLTLLALDDITTGSQENYQLEFLMVGLSVGLLSGFLAAWGIVSSRRVSR